MKTVFKCDNCEQKQKFNSNNELLAAGWRIVAWRVAENEPVCICNKCSKPNETKNKKSKSSS
jgi:hypothetical protein